MKETQGCPLTDKKRVPDFTLTEDNNHYQKFILTCKSLEMTVLDFDKKFRTSLGRH